MNVTLISSQPWNQSWFQKQFLHILKSALILKATLIVHRWIIFTFSSQCLTLEFWRGCEHYHLEWSSYRAISIVERVLIAWVKIFKYQCCIFSQRSRDVPWIVLQSKLCLCKWEVMSLISHAFKLTVHDFELSTWEDEDLTFNIPWAWYLITCQLRAELLLSYSQISIHFHDDHCHSCFWDRWMDWICFRYKSLLHSPRCFPYQIFWRLLPTYLLSSFLDCNFYLGIHWQSPSPRWC